MIRVGDLDRSLGFYVGLLGMTMFRREDYPEARFTLAFVGFGDAAGVTLELTHNWDITAYDHGAAFGHVALAVGNVATTCARLSAAGVAIVRARGSMVHVSPDRHAPEIIFFIADPDDYRVELVETAGQPEMKSPK